MTLAPVLCNLIANFEIKTNCCVYCKEHSNYYTNKFSLPIGVVDLKQFMFEQVNLPPIDPLYLTDLKGVTIFMLATLSSETPY